MTKDDNIPYFGIFPTFKCQMNSIQLVQIDSNLELYTREMVNTQVFNVISNDDDDDDDDDDNDDDD